MNLFSKTYLVPNLPAEVLLNPLIVFGRELGKWEVWLLLLAIVVIKRGNCGLELLGENLG
jgi:hypothetical protein